MPFPRARPNFNQRPHGRRQPAWLRWPALWLLAVASGPASAGTIYMCSSGHEQTIYQDKPCANARKQVTVKVENRPAPPPPAAATASAAAIPAPAIILTTPVVPIAPVVAAPLVQLYRCLHAVDGTTYTSERGNPEPFLAPLGMLGTAQPSLAEAYGPGGAGVSAPEVGHARSSAKLVADNDVPVRDRCRRLSVPDMCRYLRDELETNSRQLQHAFGSDQPPLLKRDSELRGQLTHC